MKVLVFDLGLSSASAKTLSSLASIRHFDPTAWATHVGLDGGPTGLNNYAWKPAILWTVARENPQATLFWNDATNVWTRTTFAAVESAVAKHGIAISEAGQGPGRQNTSTKTVEALLRAPFNLDPLTVEANLDRPMLGSAAVAFDMARPLIRRLLQMWLVYAMHSTIIAPEGSSIKTHKFDAAGLSLIVGNYLPGSASDVIVPMPVRLRQNADVPTVMSMLRDAVQETIDDGSLVAAVISSFAFAGFLFLIRSFEVKRTR